MFDTRTSSPGETVLHAVLISIRACTSTAFSPLRDCWCSEPISELLVDIEDGQFTRPLQAIQHCADEQSVSFSQESGSCDAASELLLLGDDTCSQDCVLSDSNLFLLFVTLYLNRVDSATFHRTEVRTITPCGQYSALEVCRPKHQKSD
jgi:hypothetical protein